MMARYINKRKNFIVYTLIISLLVGILMMLPYGNLRAEDNKNHLIPLYEIVYSDDKSKANIQFDMMSVDTEKYEITRLSSSNEELILYDVNEGIENNNYEVEHNGIYDFKISYLEKSAPSDETSTIDIPVDSAKSEPMALEEGVEVNEDENIKSVSDNDVVSNEQNEITSETLEQELSFHVEVSDIKASKNLADETESDSAVNNKLMEDVKTTPVENHSNNNQQSLSEFMERDVTGGNIRLDDKFIKSYISYTRDSAGVVKYSNDDYTQIYGNIAVLSNSQKAWAMSGASASSTSISQTTSFTSDYQIDFNRDWTLDGLYSQPFVADGFAVSFHNTKGYKSTLNTGNAALGVYGSDGLPQGLVLEVDTFAYSNYGDSNSNAKAGSHMTMQKANGTVNPILLTEQLSIAGGDRLHPTSNLLGAGSQAFVIDYKSSTRTLTWSYGNGAEKRTLTKTFASDQEIINTLGTMTPYYTLSCAMNYTSAVSGNFGSSSSGNSMLGMNNFIYNDIEPEVRDSYLSIVKNDGSLYELGYSTDASKYAKAGDTILVRQRLRNSFDSLNDISDDVLIKNSLINSTLDVDGVTYIPNSAKYYIDENNKTSISDDIFKSGAKITYPKHSGDFYIEYQVKISDNLLFKDDSSLNSEIALGAEGMSQVSYGLDLKILSNPLLTYNESDEYKSVLENKQYPLDRTKTMLTQQEVQDYFYKDLYLKKSGDTKFLNFSSILATGAFDYFMTDSYATTRLSSTIDVSSEIGNGDTGDRIAGTSIPSNKMGVYYDLFRIYDARFDQGLTPANGNTNGMRKAIRRIWVCDNYVAQNDYYAMTENFEITELELVKMSEEDFKNKILQHLQLYSESLSIDANYIISGSNCKPNKESITSANISSINGISNTSIASNTPYAANVTVELNGKTVDVPIKITVLESEPTSFVAIPKAINLDNDSIGEGYVGGQSKVRLITDAEHTSRNISILAETGFELNGREHRDEKYKVELYKSKLNSSDPVEKFEVAQTLDDKNYVELGILSSSKKELSMWLNAEKKTNAKDYYEGKMTYIIRFQ